VLFGDAAGKRQSLLGMVVLHEHLGAGGSVAFVLILLGSWLATCGGAKS